jgi:glycosyltransferase involved in cell wall biosynthesis
MKISIVSPNMSSNGLGRAHLLANILRRRYEVEIVGPMFGDCIWHPVSMDNTIKYRYVKMGTRFKPYCKIADLLRKIDGDIIYSMKPVSTSFLSGITKRMADGTPVVLDVDDWEMGFVKENFKSKSFRGRIEYLAASTLYAYSPGSCWSAYIGEKMVPRADGITVSNNFLKNKFGGDLVWHGRDTDAFNPKNIDSHTMRDEHKIDDAKKVVMFFGTPRPHKGIEIIINAIHKIKSDNIIFALVGADDRDPYCHNLIKIAHNSLGKRFRWYGLQQFKDVPKFLSMADVVVVPQNRNLSTIGQVPAKIFDAMTMAKPVISTNVSDIPTILEGCGRIVEPGDAGQMA